MRVKEFILREIINSPFKTAIQTAVSAFQLLGQHYNQLNFSQTFVPNQQTLNLKVIFENITKNPIAIPTGFLRYIDFLKQS